MNLKINNKGISLIVLVITIIVVIIIASAVILTLTGNNPISEARKATFLNDVATFKDDLNMYKTNEYAKRMGDYDPSLLNATTSGLTYNGTSVSGQDNIYDAIQSLEGKSKYNNEFEISNGELKYTGDNTERADWAQNIAGIVADSAKPTIEIATSNLLPVKAGINVQYTVDLTASTEITEVNLTGKIKILNGSGLELPTQPTVNIGSVTGTATEKNVIITINTTGMAEGIYKLKILGDAIKTASQGNIEAISTGFFEIDNTAPSMPTISINPTIATNGNVIATITKANEADTLEYSTNGTTWNAYTTTLTVTSNLTVYARETDSANNVSAQAIQIISNIDKAVPQNATMSLTTTSDKINGTITIADSGSGINVSQSKYIVATQSTAYTTTDVVWNSATVMGTTSKSISETKADGTYYVQVLSVDNAGNKLVNVSSGITVLNLPIVGKTLQDCTWEEIEKIADLHLGDTYFNIGDTKTVIINGVSNTFSIYDFNHDDKVFGGKAGITFGCERVLNYSLGGFSGSNFYGWAGSNMRAILNGIITIQQSQDWTGRSIYDYMPTDLKSKIKTVYKKSSGGYNSPGLVTTEDKLFLFSDEEIYDTNMSYSTIGEGTKYPIFINDNSRIRYYIGGLGYEYASTWATRSSYITQSDYFYGVYYNGGNTNLGSSSSWYLNFGFCI